MMKNLETAFNSPWKAFNELYMLFQKPLGYFYLVILKGVELGKGYKLYGLPKVLKHRGSRIEIGRNFENRNVWFSNPLGVNHPTIICTWNKNAEIKIGRDVGISGGAIVASRKIEIGDGTLIGANCTIIDTDFHPIKSKRRRYAKENIKSASISIGKNVFLGVGCTVLKGVHIPDDSVIPAGAVLRGTGKSRGIR